MIKKLLVLFLAFPLGASAQIPSYYSSIDFTKSGDSLKTQLASLISTTHTTMLWYTSTMSADTWDALKQSDLKIGDTSNVLLVYGYDDTDAITKNDRTRDKDSSCHTSGCTGLWNREHVFPQSKSNPPMDTQFPSMGTDAHNLRASDGQMNTSRGNRGFESGFGNAGINGNGNFYPGDEWKGDVARIIMYMYMRYGNQCEPINTAIGSTSFSPNGDLPNILLEWNAQDSVSEYEKNRNNIFQSMQGNRNPFIDNPYLATRIWNGPTAPNSWNVPLSIKEESTKKISIYPVPTNGIVHIQTYGIEINTINIYNVLGKKVRTIKNQNQIDISKYPNGLYLIEIITHKGEHKIFKTVLKK